MQSHFSFTKKLPASYVTKTSSLTGRLQNTSPKTQSFLTTLIRPSQSKYHTSIERKTSQQLKNYSTICTNEMVAQGKSNTHYKIHI